MKGLILKDFYSLKMYVRTLIVMVVIYAMLGFFSESASMFSSLVARRIHDTADHELYVRQIL